MKSRRLTMSNRKLTESAKVPIIQVDTSSLGWKIFTAFVTDNQISATEDELIDYAVNELKLQIDKLPNNLVESLPLIIVAFMNMWSGWHFKGEFLAGKFKKEHYFNRFQKFMVHKMNTTVRGQYNAAMRSMGAHDETNMRVRSVTGDKKEKNNHDFSPYAISIECPPHMLNTIVFSNIGDDVIMKQHLGSNWHDLSTIQLVNWPHVEVSFRTQDMCIVRRQATDFVRYLNFLPHECKKTNENVIEQVEALRSYGRQKNCYAYRLLDEYIKEYLNALKTLKHLSSAKLEEIQVILSQFLEDVKHINVNKSIATNTVILFRLSPVPFIRNKKLVKNPEKEAEEARVGYCEIITPKIELVMLYFRGEQKEGPRMRFDYPDKIKKATAHTDVSKFVPTISYKCTFCKVEYASTKSKKSMLDHLKKEHKMEQHVRCTVCKKQFDVLNLAACRWRHKCSTQPHPSTIIKL